MVTVLLSMTGSTSENSACADVSEWIRVHEKIGDTMELLRSFVVGGKELHAFHVQSPERSISSYDIIVWEEKQQSTPGAVASPRN